MKKFIQICPEFPLPIPIHPSEDYLITPLRVAKNSGFTPMVFTLRKNGQKNYECIHGFHVRRFNSIIDLWWTLQTAQPHTIFVHGKNLLALFCGFIHSRKIIMPHGFPETTLWKRILLFLLVRRYTFIRCLTDYEKKEFQKWLPNRCVTIPNIVNSSLINKKVDTHTVRKEFLLPPSKKIILFVGNDRPVKNIELLLRAAPLITKNHKSIIVIVGKINERLKKEYSSRSIFFLGFQPLEKISKLYKIASVFVNTSFYEGLALSACEAAVAGTPLCLPAISAFQSTFSNRAEFHSPQSVHSLCVSIDRLLKRPSNKFNNSQHFEKQFSKSAVESSLSKLLIRGLLK